MNKDILYKRVLNNRCPISDRPIEGEETEVVEFNGGKLTVIKKYIKFNKE